jgi:hypothetical protein
MDYSTGTKFWYKEMTLTDLLNTRRFIPTFDSWAELMQTKTNEEGKRKAKRVLRQFFRMIEFDIVYKGYAFVFPMKGFGMIKVSPANDKTYRKKCWLDPIETDGIIYDVVIWVSRDAQFKTRKHWKFRARWRTTTKIWCLVRNGKRYN